MNVEMGCRAGRKADLSNSKLNCILVLLRHLKMFMVKICRQANKKREVTLAMVFQTWQTLIVYLTIAD